MKKFIVMIFSVLIALSSNVATAVDATDLNPTEESDGYPCWKWQHSPPEFVMVTNTCGVPIEIKYCYFDHPGFTDGDINRTCMTEGVRTTGIIEPGASIKVMQNVELPRTGDGSGQSGFWTNTCGMKNRKAVCKIPEYNVVTDRSGNATREYRTLSVAQSKMLEQNESGDSNVVGDGNDLRKKSIKKFYAGVTTDGKAYTETARSKSEAKQLIEQSSGRTITELLECTRGWYASWTFKVMITGLAQSVGVACNASSKSEALSRALAACQRQGQNCLRASDSQTSSGIDAEAYNLDEMDFDAKVDPSQLTYSTSYCNVLDGRVSGDCYLKDEMSALGVYFE